MEAYLESPFAPIFFMVYMFVTFYYFNNVVSFCNIFYSLDITDQFCSYWLCCLLNSKGPKRKSIKNCIFIKGIMNLCCIIVIQFLCREALHRAFDLLKNDKNSIMFANFLLFMEKYKPRICKLIYSIHSFYNRCFII